MSKTSGSQPSAPGGQPPHLTKKCPDCFTYLPLAAEVCHACGRPVGPVTATGLARKPFDWRAYLAAAAAATAFAAFLWWGFFSD